MADFILIDPPVGPYSSIKDLESWLAELRGMRESPEVRDAIDQAESWLADARDHGAK